MLDAKHIERAIALGLPGPTPEQRRDVEDVATGAATYRSGERPGCRRVGLIEVGKHLAEFGLPPDVDVVSLDLTRALFEEAAS